MRTSFYEGSGYTETDNNSSESTERFPGSLSTSFCRVIWSFETRKSGATRPHRRLLSIPFESLKLIFQQTHKQSRKRPLRVRIASLKRFRPAQTTGSTTVKIMPLSCTSSAVRTSGSVGPITTAERQAMRRTSMSAMTMCSWRTATRLSGSGLDASRHARYISCSRTLAARIGLESGMIDAQGGSMGQ